MLIIKEKMQIKIFKLKQGGELLVKCNNMYWICKYIHTHVQRHTEDKVYPLNTIEQKNVVCCCPNVLLPFVFLSITHLSIDINRLWSRSLNIWIFSNAFQGLLLERVICLYIFLIWITSYYQAYMQILACSSNFFPLSNYFLELVATCFIFKIKDMFLPTENIKFNITTPEIGQNVCSKYSTFMKNTYLKK